MHSAITSCRCSKFNISVPGFKLTTTCWDLNNVFTTTVTSGPRHAKKAWTRWHVISSNLHLKSSVKIMVAVIGFSFKERFLRFQLLFLDFYHFHHVICGMKWAKKLKTTNGQNMSSGPFSHDVAQVLKNNELKTLSPGCTTGIILDSSYPRKR